MSELASTLDAVTVFPDRARVTRRGRLSLEPGLHSLEVTDLPLALVQNSVRASGRGTARARLLGIRIEIRNYLETPAEAARELEAQIQSVQDADADLAARAEVLDKALKALDGLAAQSDVFARGLAFRNRSPEDQGALYDFIVQRATALQTEILALSRQRRDLARELDRLGRELGQVQSARPRQRYAALVEVEVLSAGELEIELTYVVQSARWNPLYDLRLTGEELEVTYLAEVAQGTGEDWTNVSLTLSTARPALNLVIPELEPWYVGPRPAPRAKAVRAATRGMDLQIPAPAAAPQALMADLAEPDEEEVLLEAPTAGVKESGAALTYQISNRADVPGNHNVRKVTVASFRLRPTLDLVTAPRVEPVCYRRAQGRNESPYTLLPGPAQLFGGDEYLGATCLRHTAPGQELELALGADERVRVERKLTARTVDKTFLNDRRRIRYGYRIEVENLRDTQQTVVVRDQLPVARHEQIKVKLESVDPKPSKHTELNQLEWKLTLAPGARQVLHFDFSVESPREMELSGLGG
ncbi:MAG TPA: mucoidy inhibitor MuiA family protein [Thermoanaerobaculia bacterium]|nr:mucoidy inhibitor MuiA family protein [Thermoanaerobaculia bacterium]